MMSVAITLFLHQVRLRRGIPFALQLPPPSSDARETYLVVLSTLAQDWDTPEEDAALDEKGRGEWSAADQQRLDKLLAEYELRVLARAQAAVLLQQRGYNVTEARCVLMPALV